MTMSMTSLVGRRVYLDSNVLIYALNRTPSFAPVLAVLFERVDRGELKVSSSELALAELLVKPLREGNATAVEICRSLMIGNPSLDLVSISRDMWLEAARLRASAGLKLPDALHIAAAVGSGCDVLLTNDAQLAASRASMMFVLLSDLQL